MTTAVQARESAGSALMEMVEPVLDVVVGRIVSGFDPAKIILFGSYARGTPRRWSDLDIMVLLDRVDDHGRDAVAIRRALSDVYFPKDVVVATPAEFERMAKDTGYIHYYIRKEGRVLYER